MGGYISMPGPLLGTIYARHMDSDAMSNGDLSPPAPSGEILAQVVGAPPRAAPVLLSHSVVQKPRDLSLPDKLQRASLPSAEPADALDIAQTEASRRPRETKTIDTYSVG